MHPHFSESIIISIVYSEGYIVAKRQEVQLRGLWPKVQTQLPADTTSALRVRPGAQVLLSVLSL